MNPTIERYLARVRPARSAPPTPAPVAALEIGAPELVGRRDRLAAQFAEHQWNLGGLVYEMAARDHFALDVVVRRAARLQEIDAELAEAERLLRLDEAGAAGACPACGALHARGAAFCWQCGTALLGESPSGAPTGP